MADDIDYAEQPVPEDKDPEDYTYVERRAELYRMLEEAGHPRNLGRSQADLGERYDVSQRTISKDLERLRQYRERNVGSRAIATTEFVAEKAVRQAAENQQFDKALELQLEYNEWLFDLGAVDRAPDQLEVSGDPDAAYMEMLRQAAEESDDGMSTDTDTSDTDSEGA